jgi:hypothetical protein
LSELVNPEEHAFILNKIEDVPLNSEKIKQDSEKRQKLFLNIWLYVHGIATMIAANNLAITDGEIAQGLKDIFHALSNHYFKESSK